MDIEAFVCKAILQSRTEAIVATDREGRIRFWNAGAVRIFGFEASEAIGEFLDMIIPEKLRSQHWEGYRRVMRTGRSRYGEGDILSVPATTKAGRRISVEFGIVMLYDETGQINGLAAIMRDVTPRFEELKDLRRRLNETEVKPR